MHTIDIEKMTTQEQLQAMEALWDSLTHAAHEPVSPVWHEEIVQARREKVASGQATFVSLAELKANGPQ
ncbi:MAG: addiction module protein [Acidithiobacillus ferrivorans]